MKIKNIVSAFAMIAVLTTSSLNVFASEVTERDGHIFQKADMEYSIGRERESLGTGTLYTTKYNNGNDTPYAYAVSKANSIIYEVSVQAAVLDDNGYSYATQNVVNHTSDYAESAIIKSKTLKCIFTGRHSFRKTASSAYQYANTSKIIS